jgi:hypothetical protein
MTDRPDAAKPSKKTFDAGRTEKRNVKDYDYDERAKENEPCPRPELKKTVTAARRKIASR